MLTNCASVQTRIPDPTSAHLAAETLRQENEAFGELLVMRKRLDQVSMRILQANSDLCETTNTDFGLVTHSLNSYPKHLRDSAARLLGAEETSSVLIVRTGGPADIAGIKTGDKIINQVGNPVSALDDSLRTATNLRIRRSGQDMDFAIKPKLACAYPAFLKMSGTVNAYANGSSITLTSAMMDFAETDEELALIISHELAHNTMKHVRKAMWNTLISGFATRTTRQFESEADYVGLYYMARTGYTLDGVENFWRRLGIKQPKSIVQAKTHPVTPKRLLSLRMARLEIEAKREAGQDLLPNFKRDKRASGSK